MMKFTVIKFRLCFMTYYLKLSKFLSFFCKQQDKISTCQKHLYTNVEKLWFVLNIKINCKHLFLIIKLDIIRSLRNYDNFQYVKIISNWQLQKHRNNIFLYPFLWQDIIRYRRQVKNIFQTFSYIVSVYPTSKFSLKLLE